MVREIDKITGMVYFLIVVAILIAAIASELNVNEVTIKRDLQYLMDIARQDIRSYVQDKLPFEYMESLALLDNIKKRAFDMANRQGIGDRDKILALRLAAETEVSKERLLAESPGVLAMQTVQERIHKLENYQFQEKLRGQLQVAR
jgi:hypothetical protein